MLLKDVPEIEQRVERTIGNTAASLLFVGIATLMLESKCEPCAAKSGEESNQRSQ